MAVRLDHVPAPARRPDSPRLWRWLTLLLVLLIVGVAQVWLFADQGPDQPPGRSWAIGLVLPALVWAVLLFVRWIVYVGGHQAADAWDAARETDLWQRRRCGRRSQQVLGVSLHTALRTAGSEGPQAQLQGLRSGQAALKSQARSLDEPPVRHSRLDRACDDTEEEALVNALARVLAELAPTLSAFPPQQPLAVLLQIDTSIDELRLAALWQQVWGVSAIQQTAVVIDGHGLAALDHWLDWRIADPALLLVIALQVTPPSSQGLAETAVGLILGNRLTQTTREPIGYLHRPEQQRTPEGKALRGAIDQALDWVPVEAQAIEQLWLAGVAPPAALWVETLLAEQPARFADTLACTRLDTLLGHPGRAAPWLAIAAATQCLVAGDGAQFILSGDGTADVRLWGTAMTAVPRPDPPADLQENV